MSCPTCNGEGAIGTGYSNSFVDSADAMPCPDPNCPGPENDEGEDVAAAEQPS